jgi:predicted nucleotidyltransferase component of viral defense system
MLRTDTLEKKTLELLKKLQTVEVLRNTRLVGGTALALQIGHRISVDLDIFGDIPSFSTNQLIEELTSNNIKSRLDYASKNINQFTINNVKVDIVNYPYAWLEPVREEEGIKLADLKDITAMKLEAVTNRGSRRDFVDIYFLLKHFKLDQQIKLYMQKYPDGSSFNVLRSLTYFDDAETSPMPKMLIDVDWEQIKLSIKSAVVTY